ncbi:MAG TPA: amidohydrolase [Candidatus Bilamarchaeum sp.]|nr:amidohydrolase [Candidatus Bilamarchaeum sp.]
MSILVKGATIVTQDASRSVVRGDILVRGSRIEQVGRNLSGEAERVIDASGKIAIPGLVNAHTHVGMTILRGYGEDLPLHDWLHDKIWPAEARQGAEDAGIAARLAFCEMMRGGTTSFAEMCIHDPKFIFEAAGEAGMRGIVARGLLDFRTEGFTRRVLSEVEKSLGYGRGIVRPSVAAHAPYTCSEELMLKTKEIAKARGLKFQMHAGETRKEVFQVQGWTGKYPFDYLDSIGLMDRDSIFAHGGWLTKKEMALAGSRGASIASCPISNLKLATGGICQIAELDRAGANVCLGTDGAASNNSLDMFQTMKMASLLQKHHYWKADAISAQRILDFATLGGAAALGFECGSIEAGKLADIVLLERGPNMCPENSLVANLVYSAGPQNVSDVIIDGKLVMENRKILTLDEKKVMEEASKAASGILAGQ